MDGWMDGPMDGCLVVPSWMLHHIFLPVVRCMCAACLPAGVDALCYVLCVHVVRTLTLMTYERESEGEKEKESERESERPTCCVWFH
mmetsp:Transcript_17862/g.50798  ORF Transcript_17862/g.50798 Transcript_17862/m.50798 type:complete len:87 (+) Transcript_17862:418-678(+)